MTFLISTNSATDTEQMSMKLFNQEAKLALEQNPMPRYTREEIKFSKGIMTALRNKINLLCDADKDIPARHIYTIEQIERAFL
jgi:hypothetical protein